MIVAKPFGGLCNRLRVIDSARTLARRLGTETQVIWKTAADMVAPFDQLFDAPPDIRFRNDGRFRFIQSPADWPRVARPLVRVSNRLLGVTRAYFERDVPRIWNGEDDLSALRATDTVFFCTCQSLQNWKNLDYSWLRPQAELAERIRGHIAGFDGARVVGVHIRRTDHVISTGESPLELFVARMDVELQTRPGTKFFVATDDPETERALVDRFGQQWIHTHKKQFGRDSVEAIRDAVVDLFLLASTESLLASAASSFSETAAIIGCIPITILRRSGPEPHRPLRSCRVYRAAARS